jgi:hypothetical protein
VSTNHPALGVLRRFFAEMNAWEWEMIRDDFSDLEDLEPPEVEVALAKRSKNSGRG